MQGFGKFLLVVLALFWCPTLASGQTVADSDKPGPAPQSYILWYRNYDNPAILALVHLALEKTPEYGPFFLARSEELSQGRALRELARSGSRLVDIANVATSGQRESGLLAIPIPVDGGLLGFRVCLAEPDKLPMFRGIRTLDQLRNSGIRIGQGAHWPDTGILRASGLTVVTHPRYESLLMMLRNDRFDCFARGVTEVAYDLRRINARGLVVEPDLLIAYPMPSYLFVGRHNLATAHRLQLGLERAIEDASFGDYLKHYFGRPIAALNLRQRHMIVLDNPDLTEESRHVSRYTFDNLRRRLDLLVPRQ